MNDEFKNKGYSTWIVYVPPTTPDEMIKSKTIFPSYLEGLAHSLILVWAYEFYNF